MFISVYICLYLLYIKNFYQVKMVLSIRTDCEYCPESLPLSLSLYATIRKIYEYYLLITVSSANFDDASTIGLIIFSECFIIHSDVRTDDKRSYIRTIRMAKRYACR